MPATRSVRQTRSMTRGVQLSPKNVTKKRSKGVRAPPVDVPVYAPRLADGISLDVLEKGQQPHVHERIVNGLLTPVENGAARHLDSLYVSLSQVLYGNRDHEHDIRTKICAFLQGFRATSASKKILQAMVKHIQPKTEKCQLADPPAFVLAASILYDINLILLTYHPATQHYTLFRALPAPNKTPVYFLRYDETASKYQLMVEQAPLDRRPVPENHERPDRKQYEVEAILDHEPKTFIRIHDVDFKVRWKGYDESYDLWIPWKDLLDNTVMHAYLAQLATQDSKPPYLKRAQTAIDKFVMHGKKDQDHSKDQDQGPGPGPGPQERKRNTGRKVTVVGDMLQLKGKGGIYAVLPYEQTDDKNKAIFKIGMTTDYASRMDQMHLYFPDGVYFISILSDPDIPEWPAARIKVWKEKHNGVAPTEMDRRTEYYKRIEKYVFKYVEDHKGKRIHASTRVRNPDELQKGETEWIYTNEDTIHAAFEEAHNTFAGGRLQHFYLSGLDPDTGELVQSINDLAAERQSQVPNYTGKVIFKL